MKKLMNTKERGNLLYVMSKEGDDYVAVCLNLNIIEYGKDPVKLKESITEAAKSYIKSVIKLDLPDDELNKPAPKKYWNWLKGAKPFEDFLKESNSPESVVTKKYGAGQISNIDYMQRSYARAGGRIKLAL